MNMGDTWTPLAPIIGDGIQLITADGLKSDRVWVGTFNNGMYRIDGNAATHIGSDKLEASVNGNYGIFQIVQDPNNPFHYFAGGCDNTAHGPGAGLFESRDGGNTWSLVPGMPGMKDIWRMSVNPVKPLVYVCTSNGIMVYDWSKRTGLPTPEITPVKVDKYAENFNDGIAQGWTLNGYKTDTVTQCVYTEDWGSPSAIYDWQVAAAPFEYRIDAVSYTSDDGNRMRVIFNYRDSANYNYFDFGSSATPTINLIKVVDGTETAIATSNPEYNFTQTVSTIVIKCSADGKISVDAIRSGNTTNLFTDVEDETFAAGGKIGLGTVACASGFFDNVSLMDATSVAAPVDTHDITTYTEGFDGGQSQDWTLSAGFQVDPTGVLYCNNGDEIALYNTGIATTPFEYKVDLLTWHGEDGNKMRVYFNYVDDTSHEYIEIGGGETPTIQLKKVLNGAVSTLATYSGIYSFHGSHGWTTLDIKCGNDGLINVDAIRDGVTTPLFVNVLDDDGVLFTDRVPFSEGKIGVGTHSGFIAVDKIEVKSLAQTGPISVYTENFHDNAAQGWVYTDGITVSVKCMHVEDWGGANMAVYDRQMVYAPYQYKINFFMWPSSNKDGVKIVFGYRNEDNYDCLLIGGGSDPAKIQKVVGGNATILATSSESYDFSNSGTNSAPDPENTFDIRCDADGKINIDVIRNGVTVHLFTGVTDPDVLSGKIGLGTDRLASLYFTNVLVNATVPVAPQTTAAINAINNLPVAANLTLADEPAVKAARDLVSIAYLNDGGAVITNLDKLIECEAGIANLKRNNGTTVNPTPTPKPGNGIVELKPAVKGAAAVTGVDQATLDKAFAEVKEGQDGTKTVRLDVKAVEGVTGYELELPKGLFSAGAQASGGAGRRIEIKTAVVIPDNMFQASAIANAQNVGISIGQANVSALGEELKNLIGNRPVIELNATVDGKKISWKNSEAPVTVSVDYKPTADELKNPEHITVWYIDGEGKVQPVPSGRYNPATGRLTFTTAHFSKYAAVYVEKTFDDIEGHSWAKKQIEVLASKGVINGTSATAFTPSASITRGDFMALLVKALGLSADFDSSFADIQTGDSSYEAVGVAKKLGITNGTGNNKFSPGAAITRQDMAVLVRKALAAANKSIEKGSAEVFAKYTDASKISGYAKDSLADLITNGILKGNNLNQVNPAGKLSRAEAAVVIYAIYN